MGSVEWELPRVKHIKVCKIITIKPLCIYYQHETRIHEFGREAAVCWKDFVSSNTLATLCVSFY